MFRMLLDVPDNSPRGANGNQETLGAAWDRLERERKRDTGGCVVRDERKPKPGPGSEPPQS